MRAQLAKEAEAAVSLSLLGISVMEGEIVSLNSKISEGGDDAASLAHFSESISQLEAEIAANRAAIEENLSFLNSRRVYFEKNEIIGDPVQISTGTFLAQYVDFKAKDNITGFEVKRKYSAYHSCESFGYGWLCPFDSRIIRNRPEDIPDVFEDLDNGISCCDKGMAYADDYNQTYGNEFPSDEINQAYERLRLQKEKYLQIKENLLVLKAENEKIDELNKFAAYGSYYDKSLYKGSTNQLIFVNENGDSILFHYSGNGIWLPYERTAAQKMTLYGLADELHHSSSKDCEGGYQIVFASGDQSYYSKYGILTKKICPNGNVTYFDCTTRRDGYVILPTGERLSVRRNQNSFIDRIEGSVSGFTEYTYNGTKLVSVRDNDGVRVNFSYDSKNNLNEIKKADGKSVKLQYEFNQLFYRDMCVSVTDENGNSEHFSYNPFSREVTHINYDGGSELYRYNFQGVTVYQRDAAGNETYFYPDNRGLVERVNENGVSKYYSYDNWLRLSAISYDSGGSESYSYDSKGKVTKITDRDGFSNLWEYDSKGNVTTSFFNENKISSCSYYSNGLLKTLEENSQKKEFSYNQFGYITSKSTHADGKTLTESWEYDDKCRVIKYLDVMGIDTKISYPDLFSRIEVYGNLRKIERHFNERLFETETIETDLKTGASYRKSVNYDGRGNPLKIWMNGSLVCEYEYLPSNKLKAYTVWNLSKEGVRTEYQYDRGGHLLEERRKIIKEDDSGKKGLQAGEFLIRSCSYKKDGNNQIIKVLKDGKAIQYVYNARGFLIQELHPDGYYKNYSYTPAGRLESIADSNQNLYRRTYFRNGSYSESHQNCLHNSRKLDFNQNGDLLLSKDFMGNETYYKYDSYGNLLEAAGPSYLSKYSFDKYSRPLASTVSDSDGYICLETEISYDNAQNSMTEKVGGKINRIEYYDGWGRTVKTYSASGTRFYEYDALGNCVKVSDGKSDIFYDYTPYGSVCSKVIKTAGNDKKEIFRLERSFDIYGNCTRENQQGIDVFYADYDEAGRNKMYTNQFGNSSAYDYDSDGCIKSVISACGGETKFNKRKNINNASDFEFTVVNAEKAEFNYILNSYGALLSERSPLGKKSSYEYDRNGKLTCQTGFSGKKQIINRNYSDGSCTIMFDNGEKAYISRNPLGNINRMESDFSSIEYDYDRGGRLTRSYDRKNDIEILYDYDDFGRCISKKGINFDFSYSYNDAGFIAEISEINSSFKVQLLYDELNREVIRKYSNGVQVRKGYNEYGQKIFTETRDSLDNLICADYMVYDDKNRLQYVCDKNLSIRQFSYDEKGRLISTCFPYDKEICDFGIKEALDCGLYLKSDHPDGKNICFNSGDLSKINKSLEAAGNPARVSEFQYSWIEKYEYTACGAVKSLENPLGKINYEYDALGRLLKKYASNSKDEGMSFFWNDDNCLERIAGRYNETLLSYGAIKRPVMIESRNLQDGNYSIFEFHYDLLGRRIYEKYESNKNTALENLFIYDGFGNNLLVKSPVRQNGISAYSGLYASKNEIEEGVRTGIFEKAFSGMRDGYNMMKDSASSAENDGAQNEYRLADIHENYESNLSSRSCLFMNISGSPSVVLYSAVSGIRDEADVIASDFRGNACAVLSGNSECSSLIEYDTWGNVIKEGENKSFSGSTGSNYAGLLFYNLSARDYSPELKCFISMDPARDGANWFAYCSCDPVNYRDSSGLKKNSATELENFDYAYAILCYAYEFSLLDYSSKGNSYYMPGQFDCADVSFAMDCFAAMYAGLENYSDKATAFMNSFMRGDIKGAADAVCSSDFFSGDESSFRKKSDGFDRDLLTNYKTYYKKNGEYEDVPAYISEMRKRADAISELRNPNTLTPGTVLVWKKSDNPDPSFKGNWKGHTMMVVARTFDDKGYVTGFAYIEGHTGGNKTRIGFMNVAPDSAVEDYDGSICYIDSIYGNFLGLYDIDSNIKTGSCEK